MFESRGKQFSPAEQLKISLVRHASGAKIIFDDEYRNRGIPGNHYRPDYASLSKNHVVAGDANTTEAIGLEDANQILVGERAKFRRAPGEAAESDAPAR
jgi:hypothetical protein